MEGLLWCAQVIVESGAKACEVMVSGQFCRQRTKSVKVVDGLRIHSGGPFNYDIDTAVYHMMLRQVMLGIKVKIMLSWDPSCTTGLTKHLPDHVSIVEPKMRYCPLPLSQNGRV
ncbi:40S ribosomal protein S3-B [Camelus dromedarius]|uniref:40S ribosomal protein S3 n=1 Tax=Camelus dromedarius TaxID=9838 RepID=A0A5N4EDB3_CAMDR|nr:40S ribosomal protein S3-B [Camelus dromedarius]